MENTLNSPQTPKNLPKLSDFAGMWQIDRQIQSDIAPHRGRFLGQVQFAMIPEGLQYHETGALCFEGGPTMQADRRYLWRAARGGIDIFFEDGRYFHSITGAQTAMHDCAPDTYEVAYEFAKWPVWQSTWRVTGPRKNYVMTSKFTRL